MTRKLRAVNFTCSFYSDPLIATLLVKVLLFMALTSSQENYKSQQPVDLKRKQNERITLSGCSQITIKIDLFFHTNTSTRLMKRTKPLLKENGANPTSANHGANHLQLKQ